ncbi:MAG TPA: RHS repeat-associated core domain-containing protein [Candidatus Acidoferrum sp.]|nr:RHS repeat-associated core domain-containing protein [Candidatus Acidoferrum sp.]
MNQTAYNANNQLTTWGTANLFYDTNGNMTSDGTHSYTWDARNRLKQIDLGNTASFTYDPFGRRATKSIVGTNTTFLYDGANTVQEVIGGTNTANSLSGGIDEVFQRTDSAGARSFLADPLGSTLALADSTGTLQTQYTFEPFGNTTLSGSATTNSFAYTGRELDASNLYYYRARYYNPQIGRFISEDPLGLGTNAYQYAAGNPVSFADPLGLWPELYEIPGIFWRAYDWSSGAYTAGQMTWEFASGTGPQSRDFGPDSVQVQSLKNSPGINKARDYFNSHGCQPIPNGGHPFGLKGLWQSGLDPTLQFVGSYDWTAYPNSNGTVTFTVTNDTSLTSLLYQAGVPSHSRDSFGPFGTTTQTYHWTEPMSGRGCGCNQ